MLVKIAFKIIKLKKMKAPLSLTLSLLLTLFAYEVNAYNLNDAIAKSLQNSEKIKSEQQKLRVALLEKPKAVSGFLPNISADLKKTFYQDKLPGVSSEQRFPNYNQGSLNLIIQQEVYSGGSTLSKIVQSDAIINAAYQNYTKALNEVIYKTVQTYQQVLNIKEALRVQKENVRMSKKSVEKASVTVKSGSETKTSLLAAKSNLADMERSLANYKTQLMQSEAAFEYYIGERAPDNMEKIDLDSYKKIPSLKDFQTLVMNNNPDIQIAKSNFKATKEGVKIATAGLFPTVTAFGQFARQDGSTTQLNNNSAQQRTIRSDSNTYGLQMHIPIFNKAQNYIAIAESRRTNKQYEHNLKDFVRSIHAQTISDWDSYITNTHIYKLALEAEDNYYQTYKAVQTEYEAGAKTIFNVINSQRNYNDAIVSRLQAERDEKLALFGLYKLGGKLQEITVAKQYPKNKDISKK
jgi:outer membrane protein